MDWPISEVARMSGVTARTLPHYDEIGLPPPARIGSNGHRYYEEHQLLLLQQILVLRELGVGLPESGRPMTAIKRPENLFEGIEPSQYEGNLRDFPGLAEEADRRAAAMTPAEVEAGQRERTALMIRPAEHLAGGAPADADPVQAEIDGQYRALTSLHAVSADEYRAIGRSCVENDDWRAAYEAIAPGLAEYQRDAIEAYAMSRLG
ncbi:MerR family transcriptional regulator [Streptomyces globisporus]